MRTFLGFPLPAAVAKELHHRALQLARRTIERGSLRVVPPENLHITLLYLGEIDAETLRACIAVMRRESDSGYEGWYPPTFQIFRYVLFPPDSRHPRVLAAEAAEIFPGREKAAAGMVWRPVLATGRRGRWESTSDGEHSFLDRFDSFSAGNTLPEMERREQADADRTGAGISRSSRAAGLVELRNRLAAGSGFESQLQYPFRPHITVGRITRTRSPFGFLPTAAAASRRDDYPRKLSRTAGARESASGYAMPGAELLLQPFAPLEITLRKLVLYRSILSREGASYDPLFTIEWKP